MRKSRWAAAVSRHRVYDSLTGNPWAGVVAAYFLAMPVLQAVSFLTGTEFLNYDAHNWRHFVIYGVAAPWVGYLCLVRSPRARLAAYVFLSVDIFRSLAAAHFLPAAPDGGLLLYLQTKHMRKSFPPINSSKMHARLMARASRLGALIGDRRKEKGAATMVKAMSHDRGPAGVAPRFRPGLVSWNLTSACNLRCSHCYLAAGERRDGELSTEECYRIIDQMAALGTDMVILSGGEPLLRRDVFAIAQYASHQGIIVVMGSNGVLLDEGVATALKASGVQGVGISVDSLHAHRHDSFRGVKGCWERAIKGIDACMKQGLQVVVQTTATRWNYGEIPALIDFACVQGATAFNLYYLVCTGRGEELTDITPQQYEESLSHLVKTQPLYPGMMVRAKCAPHVNRIAYQQGLPPTASAGCLAGTGYLRIGSEGEVTPCPYLPVVVGNLRKASLGEIWNGSAVLQGLRESRLEGRCGVCEYARVCAGCRARAWATGGRLLGEDPWCSYQPGSDSAPPAGQVAWSREAEERLQRAPSFIRTRVKLAIEAYARSKGHTMITPELMTEVRKAMGGHGPAHRASH